MFRIAYEKRLTREATGIDLAAREIGIYPHLTLLHSLNNIWCKNYIQRSTDCHNCVQIPINCSTFRPAESGKRIDTDRRVIRLPAPFFVLMATLAIGPPHLYAQSSTQSPPVSQAPAATFKSGVEV